MPTPNHSMSAVFTCLLALLLGLAGIARAEPPLMEITLGHSRTIWIEEDIATAALGNPDIAEVVVVKPNTLLINGKASGATSLTLFGKSGHLYDYRLLVTRDLSLLRSHLRKLDDGIHVETDPNGDAVVLTGMVATKAIIDAAEAAAIRFFAETTAAVRLQPREVRESVISVPAGTPDAAAQPQPTVIPGARNGLATIEQTMAGNTQVRVINLLMTAEVLLPPAQQMERLLRQVDPRISVTQVNEVFVLKGRVATPAALSRALAMADRFVSQEASPDIRVFSDQGGVLAGDLTGQRDEGVEPVDPVLSVQQIGGTGARSGRTGARSGGTGGRGGVGGGGAAAGLRQPLHENKGNLAQNISRGDVVTAAAGLVMSLLQVDEQPRVEMQLRIVAVDRNRTDELGIDWRLDGNRISIGSLHGGVVSTLPAPTSSAPIDTGSANLIAAFFPGSYSIQAFLRAVEDKGAANTLSEPLLTAVSGESTSFLVGGSIPVPTQTLVPGTPTANPIGATNVLYLDYGLKLIVRPTVLENGKISIVLDQSISEPDYGRQIKLLGEPVPAFTQRTVSTVTEAEDGETWAVAGLITEEVSRKLRAVPFISRVPVLGALFRNKTDKDSRTELMITVTARRIGAAAQVTALRDAEAPQGLTLPGAPADAAGRAGHDPASLPAP